MRILILSNYPWKNTNSFGNTYSSIFGKVPNTEIAHIYMFEGKPDPVPNITSYYQIPEADVIRSVICKRKGNGAGRRIEVAKKEEKSTEPKEKSTSIYARLLSIGKKHHWNLLFIGRELAWKFGHVNYQGLMDFVNEFKPDLFFLPYSNVYYTNRIALYIKEHTNIPMVTEMEMDHYSLKRISYNPFFWSDRLCKRKMIRKLAKESEMIFAISKKLKEELEKGLKKPCKILYKTPNKSRSYKPYDPCCEEVRFLFTGNIYANRWKSLAMLAEVLQKQGYGHLDIYTSTPITSAIDKALNINGVSEVHPPVSQDEVINLQNTSDVLVHAESFDKYNKSLVRCAISTKIMDYLSVGRCILAIGPSDISSIEYLADNDVALIADSKEKLSDIIGKMKNDKNVIMEYANKGRNYVINYLDEDKIRKIFYNELQSIIDNYKKNGI